MEKTEDILQMDLMIEEKLNFWSTRANSFIEIITPRLCIEIDRNLTKGSSRFIFSIGREASIQTLISSGKHKLNIIDKLFRALSLPKGTDITNEIVRNLEEGIWRSEDGALTIQSQTQPRLTVTDTDNYFKGTLLPEIKRVLKEAESEEKLFLEKNIRQFFSVDLFKLNVVKKMEKMIGGYASVTITKPNYDTTIPQITHLDYILLDFSEGREFSKVK